jgi:acetolactate synthase-1/2/3 large subunit
VTGPGVTNAATAIGEAFADSSRMLVIATNLERKYLDTLQGNLHEITDQMGVVRPIVKWAERVMEASEIPSAIAEAMRVLHEGRPRPVYLEIPIDVLAEEIDWREPVMQQPAVVEPDAGNIRAAGDLIRRSSRVMLFTGGGANTEDVAPLVAHVAELLGAPVVMSLMGKGSIPADHPYCAGAFGYRWSADNPAAAIMHGSDLAIAIGTGLGVRTTGDLTMPLPDNLIHIDIDASEVGTRFKPAVGIVADAARTLRALIAEVEAGARPRERWSVEEVAAVREQLMEPADARASGYLPYLKALRSGMERDAILTNDMTMMAYEGARYFPVYEPRTYTFPRGFGTLGSSMPTALGAKLGRPDRQVVSIAGDGGFQFTMEEIGAAVHHRIPVAMVIFNDSTHTAVKAAQRRSFRNRYIDVDLINPDYVKLADAYGIPGIRATSPDALTEALVEARGTDGPVLIDVPISLETY